MRRLLLLLPLALAACTTPREVLDVTVVDRPPDVTADSLAAERARTRVTHVPADRPRRDVAPERRVDVLHTALDLRLDLARRAVEGTATHRLVPLRDSLGSFYLHAVGMDVAGVDVLRGPVFDVAYDSARLVLTPARALARTDTLELRVAYTAFPERAVASGRGQGLYFINPDGTDPYRPTQVWTQGQPEDNRRWFPTWDYPNDKMTFEIALAVPDSLVAFANGERVASEALPGGFRRDVFRLDAHPQPAYLAALAVGRFAVVEDAYVRPDGSRVPLAYVVEPRFAERARADFGETPRMFAAFESYLGLRYPWPRYTQVAVRDFTAGGMENTTLTLLFEGAQTEARGEPGRRDDLRDLLSHELIHHWFGNLVTAEDWANLAVNEALATWGEELYRELAYGPDFAQDRALRDREIYLAQARTLRRPIVWYGYDDPEQLFDQHTYHKGGRVMAQLRFELGDDVFRRGLRTFLTAYAGQSVSIDELRRAMEQASGRSLRRFFSQWFEQPGHPALAVEQAYFAGSQLYTIRVVQRQDREREPVFHFDVDAVVVYPSGAREARRLRVASADTTFQLRLPERPRFVQFGTGAHLPAEFTWAVPVEELAAQARDGVDLAGRVAAIEALGRAAPNPVAREALLAATADALPFARARAASALGAAYPEGPGVAERLARLAATDPDAEVRVVALGVLSGLPEAVRAPWLEEALGRALADEAYVVVAAAAAAYGRALPRRAYEAFERAGTLRLRTWGGIVERPLAEALGRAADPRGRPALEALLGPEQPD
ncbi:MAG: M1 family metallopeptidase, partial [Rubricoccaceae bacterium]